MRRAAWLGLAIVLSLPSHAAAQLAAPVTASDHPIFGEGRRTMTAERLGEGEDFSLDGRLDEPFWQRAQPATDFIMQDPILGGTPTEQTEVRIAFDRDNLYMGVTAHDSEPDRLLGNTMRRDETLQSDDRFMWTMDTFLDQQSGYFFEMNPYGLMADAVMGPGGSNNRQWDGIWDARVVRSEIGWTLEIVIPFRTLNFDPNAPAWGINFQRTVRRKSEEALWTGHQRNQGLRRMSNAGLLVGIQDVSQGVGLDVRPYAAGHIAEAPGRVPPVGREESADVGLDVFYNLTPNLRANLTVNTDFAETEVDQRQVNLTRFPIQFPEKRAFFLEGGTFFDFAQGAPVQPFFSRRIGLDQNGQPQTIDGGAKLTGQAGANDVGVLLVRTGSDQGIVGEDFGVMRVRRRVLTQSYFGGIYTWRHERGSAVDDRHTAGVDFRLATSSFLGSENLELSGFVLGNTIAGSMEDALALGGRLAYPNDLWSGSLDVSEVQANHNPALGFVRRRAFRSYSPSINYAPRPQGHPLIRQFRFGAGLSVITDMANTTVTREWNLFSEVSTHAGDNVGFGLTPTYELLDDDFQISPGVILPTGTDYHFTRWRVGAGTANRRVIAVNGSYSWGGFFSGDRQETSIGLALRPRPGIRMNGALERNRVDLAQGSFTTNLYRLILDTQLNPRVYAVNNIQYDSVSRVLGWQVRFRWILTPGNDLYLVYQHNWLEGPSGVLGSGAFSTLDRRAATKLSYTHRF
ncbi:MAG: hydrolase [Gemmatimonadetes bacterium]|nr:hydrolase [Gemmatimonadota bacterium]